MIYNPKSMRAGLIAKHLPNLYKSYQNCGNLNDVVKIVKDFGVENLNISNDIERGLVKKLVFDCTDSVLRIGIRNAYLGMPDIDKIKNPKTLPNYDFSPIFPKFSEFVEEFKTDLLLSINDSERWLDSEKEFVFKWHNEGKLPKQIANHYMKFVEGGSFCDENSEPFTNRSVMGVLSFIGHCYEDGFLKPQRISWEKNEDLAFAAYWISYLEKNEVSYKGYIKRTTSTLNDYFFEGDSKINNRSLECFLKRDSSVVSKVK
jgi:hypothetical protein